MYWNIFLSLLQLDISYFNQGFHQKIINVFFKFYKHIFHKIKHDPNILPSLM